ncbi:MAG: sulfite exporter TauE/SafE family protein [Alphaproteobacteria bacterium]|nr:sulfite exporter TauE/SafE family protein [Alphaproteobacteria bacterium]
MHEHHQHLDLAWLSAMLPDGLGALALPLALLLAGVVAGATHCTAMCGPFVLVRAARAGAGLPVEAHGLWLRLRSGALPAYHAGRALTYGVFGAVAGAFGAGLATIVGLGWVRYASIALAIILLLAPIWRRITPPQLWQGAITRLAGRAARAPGLTGDFALGAALGFLPCGMIYMALAAAAGAGSAPLGALSMAAFAAGTWLPLAVLGAVGAASGRRLRHHLNRWAIPVTALNLLALGVWFGHAA